MRRRSRASSAARSGWSTRTCRRCCRSGSGRRCWCWSWSWGHFGWWGIGGLPEDPALIRPDLLESGGPGGFSGELGLPERRVASFGVVVGAPGDPIELFGLERSAIGDQRHRAGAEVGHDRVGFGVGQYGIEDRRNARVRGPRLHTSRIVVVADVGDVAGERRCMVDDERAQGQECRNGRGSCHAGPRLRPSWR